MLAVTGCGQAEDESGQAWGGGDTGDAGGDDGVDGGGSDACPENPEKTAPGECGCDVSETDADGDDTPDCLDECPDDPDKTEPGTCGCGVSDDDSDDDGLVDCEDNCPSVDNADQVDGDRDAVGSACDNCVGIPNADQDDSDNDGIGDGCACAPTPLYCEGGIAGGTYDCNNVDLLARLPLDVLETSVASDLWGWTDSQTGHEYALVGVTNSTVIVDVSYPFCPVVVGRLPTQTGNGPLRDIKVIDDFAFIVAEADNHGIQVFDLTQLRRVTDAPVTFEPTAHYSGHGRAHNIVADVDSGFVFSVGGPSCDAGLHIVDVRDPTAPTFAGCFSELGYIHDAQCLIYAGPDQSHVGKELCFVLNGSLGSISVVDVGDKENPAQLSYKNYSGASFAHQGWLTEDQAYFLSTDEFDESNNGHYTRTYIWDVRDLDNPKMIGSYESPTPATDHNLFNHRGYSYKVNYQAGLRILDLAQVGQGTLTEVAHFDTHPTGDGPALDGAFGVYPFFESGIAVVTDMERGLFILMPTLDSDPPTPPP